MAENISELAHKLGARVVGELPDVGGGALGAARMAALVQSLRNRSQPDSFAPSDLSWVATPNVPISEATARKIEHLAEIASRSGRKVSAIQMAAQLLEDAVAALPDG